MSHLQTIVLKSLRSIQLVGISPCGCICNQIFQSHLNTTHKSNARYLSTSSTLKLFFEPDRKDGYETKTEKKSPKEVLRESIQGIRKLKGEFQLLQEEWKEKWEDDRLFVRPGDMDKKWVFENENDLQKWKVASDSDFGDGFSKCSLKMSPTGHGLFSGNLNTEPAKDGRAKYSGYCNIQTIKPVKSFQRDLVYDWTPYTHLEIRVRGDGRPYMVVLNTPGYFDVNWFDTYTYPLYTRGGPYWQTSRIPFSKFFLSSKGRIQDRQIAVNLLKISTLGFSLADLVDGPFNLEIDYVGLYCHPTHKEEFAYELYEQPHKFYANH